jgi:peptidoglycan hydrolase-like protein with peptidoglycan-binding domain
MIRVTVRHGDGLGDREWLRSVVARAQAGLTQAGHGLQADGLFGDDTKVTVRRFQAGARLAESGVVDKPTWNALAPDLKIALGPQMSTIEQQLSQFHGDLDWVHRQEGHAGHPYWPGGASGVTLDPGVDLGQAEASVIGLYEPLTTAEQFAAMQTVIGVRRQAAKDALDANPVLQSVRIGADQAEGLMAFTAKPYWSGIGGRFSALRQPTTIGSVQTALLSLAYNRGAPNPALAPLEAPLAAGRWPDVADLIDQMQQEQPTSGIATRRREEAFIIRSELAYLDE